MALLLRAAFGLDPPPLPELLSSRPPPRDRREGRSSSSSSPRRAHSPRPFPGPPPPGRDSGGEERRGALVVARQASLQSGGRGACLPRAQRGPKGVSPRARRGLRPGGGGAYYLLGRPRARGRGRGVRPPKAPGGKGGEGESPRPTSRIQVASIRRRCAWGWISGGATGKEEEAAAAGRTSRRSRVCKNDGPSVDGASAAQGRAPMGPSGLGVAGAMLEGEVGRGTLGGPPPARDQQSHLPPLAALPTFPRRRGHSRALPPPDLSPPLSLGRDPDHGI